MIVSESRNHCGVNTGAVVMDLSTHSARGAGESGTGNGDDGRRRSRPAKSVFSIRSLVGDSSTVECGDDERVDTSPQPDGEYSLHLRTIQTILAVVL